MKRLLCLVLGHDTEVITVHDFDPDTFDHTFTQVKKCLRCGKILLELVTKL